MSLRRIGVLTAGGDAPGLNAVVRAVVKQANQRGVEVVGFMDGFTGLIKQRHKVLDPASISGILPRGGTILGTSNKDNPFNYEGRDLGPEIVKYLKELGIECLIFIGGDGSMSVAKSFLELGLPTVGVPKTIDNDLGATDQTFGFDTAVGVATEALDRLHTTAEAHHRIMVLEVMGRYTGWIALASGIAGGADAILIPEIPFSFDFVARRIIKRKHDGKHFSIVVVAEGARTPEGEMVVARTIADSHEKLRLGGIGNVVGAKLEELTGLETRVTVLGHIQRGGSPTPFDRILATRYGVHAANLAIDGRYGRMVALRSNTITDVPLTEAGVSRPVPLDSDMVRTAKAVGISFGDE
ncbi:MAG TPA: ATP-dependent 6-phosphofructokinase [Symbiobacteriaceae bacterium]|nr:ATP-dependent 6-phosphofructokinase [Symbiobacteriaceae bacterium]